MDYQSLAPRRMLATRAARKSARPTGWIPRSPVTLPSPHGQNWPFTSTDGGDNDDDDDNDNDNDDADGDDESDLDITTLDPKTAEAVNANAAAAAAAGPLFISPAIVAAMAAPAPAAASAPAAAALASTASPYPNPAGLMPFQPLNANAVSAFPVVSPFDVPSFARPSAAAAAGAAAGVPKRWNAQDAINAAVAAALVQATERAKLKASQASQASQMSQAKIDAIEKRKASETLQSLERKSKKQKVSKTSSAAVAAAVEEIEKKFEPTNKHLIKDQDISHILGQYAIVVQDSNGNTLRDKAALDELKRIFRNYIDSRNEMLSLYFSRADLKQKIDDARANGFDFQDYEFMINKYGDTGFELKYGKLKDKAAQYYKEFTDKFSVFSELVGRKYLLPDRVNPVGYKVRVTGSNARHLCRLYYDKWKNCETYGNIGRDSEYTIMYGSHIVNCRSACVQSLLGHNLQLQVRPFSIALAYKDGNKLRLLKFNDILNKIYTSLEDREKHKLDLHMPIHRFFLVDTSRLEINKDRQDNAIVYELDPRQFGRFNEFGNPNDNRQFLSKKQQPFSVVQNYQLKFAFYCKIKDIVKSPTSPIPSAIRLASAPAAAAAGAGAGAYSLEIDGFGNLMYIDPNNGTKRKLYPLGLVNGANKMVYDFNPELTHKGKPLEPDSGIRALRENYKSKPNRRFYANNATQASSSGRLLVGNSDQMSLTQLPRSGYSLDPMVSTSLWFNPYSQEYTTSIRQGRLNQVIAQRLHGANWDPKFAKLHFDGVNTYHKLFYGENDPLQGL